MKRKSHHQLIVEYLGSKCFLCGASENLQLHHKEPLEHGGSDSIENLTLLCVKCHRTNLGKSNSREIALRLKNEDFTNRILECLNGNPSTLKEIAQCVGDRESNTMSKLVEMCESEKVFVRRIGKMKVFYSR